MSVINVYPRDIINRYAGGHWKAIKAFHLLTSELSHKVIEIPIDQSSSVELIELCTTYKSSTIVFQYSFWPDLIKELRFKNPHLNIYVRTINAEALQHWQRSDIKFALNYSNLRNIYGSLRLLLQDQQCRWNADCLLGISEWDNRHYWKFLPGKANIEYLPYHCPWPFLRPAVVPVPWNRRQNTIVCLPGGRDPIGLSQVNNFIHFARVISNQDKFKSWFFELSPGVYRNDETANDMHPVTLMPELEEPWDLLCSVKALAILTPLGFGSKTTIIDALTAGCHVLVNKTLAKRLPDNVRRLCHKVDMRQPDQFIDLIGKIEHEPQPHHLNDELIAQARLALEQVLIFV